MPSLTSAASTVEGTVAEYQSLAAKCLDETLAPFHWPAAWIFQPSFKGTMFASGVSARQDLQRARTARASRHFTKRWRRFMRWTLGEVKEFEQISCGAF